MVGTLGFLAFVLSRVGGTVGFLSGDSGLLK